MKKPICMLGLAILQAVSLSMAIQDEKVHPYRAGKGISPGKATQRCAILDTGEMSFRDNLGPITIYEAGENVRTESGADKVYYYEPRFRVALDAGRPLIRRWGSRLQVNLVPSLPSQPALLRFLKAKDQRIAASNLRPMCGLAYAFSHPDALSPYVTESPLGSALDAQVVAQLSFASDQVAERVYQELMEGGSIRFGYTALLKTTTKPKKEILWNDVLSSDAYRDFLSPVHGNLIWVTHSRLAVASLDREIRVKHLNEGNRLAHDPILDQLWSDLFLTSREQVVTFEQLSQGAAAVAHLEDLRSDRYGTDKITRFAIDAKTMSHDEWCNKYKNEFDFDQQEQSRSSTGGSFLSQWLFLKGGHKSQDRYRQSLETALQTEDCGKQLFKDSFAYEEEGARYIPKGIIAYETINHSATTTVSQQVEVYNVDQEYRNVERDIIVDRSGDSFVFSNRER